MPEVRVFSKTVVHSDGVTSTSLHPDMEDLAEAAIVDHGWDLQQYYYETGLDGIDALLRTLEEADGGIKLHWDEHVLDAPLAHPDRVQKGA